MNLANVRRVFLKELKETIRDRRTLMVMLVVPVFLYPVLLIVVEQLAIFGQRQLEEAPAAVVAQGAGPDLLRILQTDPEMAVREDGGAQPEAVARGEIDVIVRYDAAPGDARDGVRIYYDASRDRSRRARSLVLDRLDVWSDTLLAERLAERGLPPDFASPLAYADSSVATAQQMGGYALGRFLPMLLILMTLLGAFYPAIDLSAGEKERGTLETLLTTPVPPREVVAGKFLTVALIALTAATLNLVSMLLTFQLAAFQFASAMEIQLSLPWTTLVLVLLFLIPLVVFFSALFLGLALRAQSFKEAQNTLTPVQLASMIPMMLPLIPGIPLSYAVALVPIGGVALLFRELMVGEAPVGPALLALGTTILYAGLALRYAAASFGREEVLFGTGAGAGGAATLRDRFAGWKRGPRRRLRPPEALALVALVALLYFYLGVTIQIRLGEIGILVSQVLLLALPVLLFVRLGPFRVREALALRAPTPVQLGAGTLIVLGAIPLGWTLAWLQTFVMEMPEEFLAALEELVRADTAGEFLWLLLLVAITPAICEELLFRGALLQGLSNGMTPARAITVSAAVFGAFHLSTETVIRFLPSAGLGVVLGYVVWRTGSLFVGAAMHFVNNGFIVVLVAMPRLQEGVVTAEGEPRWTLVAAGAVLLVLGFRLLHASTPAPRSREASPAPPS